MNDDLRPFIVLFFSSSFQTDRGTVTHVVYWCQAQVKSEFWSIDKQVIHVMTVQV